MPLRCAIGAGDVFATFGVDHLKTLVFKNQFLDVIECDIAAFTGVVEASIGVLLKEAHEVGFRKCGYTKCL